MGGHSLPQPHGSIALGQAVWMFRNPADGEAQVAFPFSGGDEDPESPPGFVRVLD